LSAGQKEEINAHNRRAKQNNLTDEKREEINARRRARYRDQRNILPDEQKEDSNARRRAAKQTSKQRKTQEEMAAMLDQRRAKVAARKNTPCKESIAMPCPVATLPTINLASSTQRKTTGERTSSPPAPPSTSTPEYTIRTDGNTPILTTFIYIMAHPDHT